MIHPSTPPTITHSHTAASTGAVLALDLGQQAAELRLVGREHTLGQALQPSAQDGDGGTQFVGDGRVPEQLFLGHAL